MSPEPNEPCKESPEKPGGGTADPVVRERVQELTWALLDEQILDDEMKLLDNLLLSDDSARDTYIQCVQLHTDLMQYHRQPMPQATSRTGKSLVLGFLSDSLPAMTVESPPSGDATT